MKDNILGIAEVLILLTGIGVSLFFLSILKINHLLAWVLFAGWVLAPYIAGTIRGYLLSNVPLKKFSHVIALLITVIAGLYLLLDAIYINPDPQGGLVVLMVPILQIPIYLVVYFVALLRGNKGR